jgi:hypothetical protein
MEIYVLGIGIPDVKDRVVEPNHKVSDFLSDVVKLGFPAEALVEALVFVEDQDEPIEHSRTMQEAGVQEGARVHVHTCRRIEVSCNYNGQTKKEKFAPTGRIRRVKDKFGDEFKIDPLDLGNFTLLICGSQTEPDENTQIGSLTTYPKCELCFDLVKRENVQGAD